MTHPEELLAAYVDGTLTAKERAAVDTHVAGCDRCRREVAAATRARGALSALGEVPAPEGVAGRALQEAGLGGSGATAGRPRWYRAAAIAAAAAAVALLLVVVLPNPRGGDGPATLFAGDASGGAEAGDSIAATESASVLEVRDADYDADGLSGLLAPYRKDQAAAGAPDQARLGNQAETDRALGCLNRAAPDAGGELAQLIQARFRATPAYFGIFLEGPGVGQAPDTATVWVVSRSDCTIVSFAQAKL